MNNKLYNILDTTDNYIEGVYKQCKDIYLKKIKDKEKVNLNVLQEMVKYLKDNNLLQTIFFSFSRKNCETYANIVNEELVQDNEIMEINHIWNKYLNKDESKYICLEQYTNLKSLVKRGIAYHHSGLIPILKEIIEILFQKGLIKILFATETFAVGVNMPTRSVVFTELEKNTNGGKRFLNTAEFKQMSGRAGRRGIDTVGYSIILPLYNFIDELDLKNILIGKIPKIISKFNIDYNYVLKLNNNNIANLSLKELDKNKVKLQLENELVSLYNTFNNFDTTLFDDNQDIQKIKFLINIKEKIDNYIKQNIKYNMNAKEKKDYTSIQKELQTNDKLKQLNKAYIEYYKVNSLIKQKEDELYNLNNENDINIQNILNILQYNNYVDDKYNLLQKGIIASQINECNSLLFTEIIFSNILDDLNELDIVALLSIFIDEKTDEEVYTHDLIHTKHLIHKFNQIKKYVDNYINLENKFHTHSLNNFWNISFNNIDASYLWASGQSITYLKANGFINYEGNFIKNITKIYNITNNLISISNIIQKVDLLSKLEKIPQLIIRDIVSLSSLYLL
jgi:antiviral helicase SKI2